MIRVRHSTFSDRYGWALREITKRYPTGEEYPGVIVEWDGYCAGILDTIVANYNLVFIVPAGRKLI